MAEAKITTGPAPRFDFTVWEKSIDDLEGLAEIAWALSTIDENFDLDPKALNFIGRRLHELAGSQREQLGAYLKERQTTRLVAAE